MKQPTKISLDRHASTLQFRRHFDCGRSRIWNAITDDTQMSTWYPTAVTIEPRVGGRITLTFPGAEPEDGIVVECEPEQRLAFEGGGVRVTIALEAAGDGTDMEFTTGVPDIQHAASLAAGYDLSLEQLDVLLTDGPSAVSRAEMPPPPDRVQRYASAYGLPTDI